MATSSRNRAESGFTLLEMLVALAIGAVAAAALLGLTRTVSPRLELTRAAEQVAGDFNRARAEARRTGREVAVTLSQEGYRIEALDLAEPWPVEARWTNAVITFQPVTTPAHRAMVELTHDGARAQVRIAPVSGQAHVQRLD